MKLKNVIIFVICALVYCIPMGLVVTISNNEIESYIEDKEFDFQLRAYGDVKQIRREDMREYYKMDAVVTCVDEYQITISNGYELCCEVEDEVHNGQVLATYGGNDVIADFDGRITNIEYGDKLTISYNDFQDLVYEVYVDESRYSVFDNKEFQDAEGNRIDVIEKSNMLVDGKFKVILSIPNKLGMMYGKSIEGFELYTGKVYNGALVVDKDCVYAQGDKYYIRVVDEQGIYLEDVEVTLGFMNEEFICVSGDGIDEGVYCDSGYSKIEEDSHEED